MKWKENEEQDIIVKKTIIKTKYTGEKTIETVIIRITFIKRIITQYKNRYIESLLKKV